MNITAALQFILTAVQSLSSQDYSKVSNDDTWACWCIILQKRAGTDKQDYRMFRKKILTWKLREARRGLKAIISNRVTARPSLHLHSFLFFFVSFNQSLVFPGSRLCSKACQHKLNIMGLSQAVV